MHIPLTALANEFPKRWIAVFDILGFTKQLENHHPVLVLDQYYAVLEKLYQTHEDREGISISWFSDTFVIYSEDDDIKRYADITQIARHFFLGCLYIGVPTRAAISYGALYVDRAQGVIVGQALVDAYKYADGQDWIGLLLLPSAINKARENGLEPLRHAFSKSEIPWKKSLLAIGEILAYSFNDASFNFEHPAVAKLDELQRFAPEKDKVKYARTLEHLKKYYRRIPTGQIPA
jgi:hypothetical protein